MIKYADIVKLAIPAEAYEAPYVTSYEAQKYLGQTGPANSRLGTTAHDLDGLGQSVRNYRNVIPGINPNSARARKLEELRKQNPWAYQNAVNNERYNAFANAAQSKLQYGLPYYNPDPSSMMDPNRQRYIRGGGWRNDGRPTYVQSRQQALADYQQRQRAHIDRVTGKTEDQRRQDRLDNANRDMAYLNSLDQRQQNGDFDRAARDLVSGNMTEDQYMDYSEDERRRINIAAKKQQQARRRFRQFAPGGNYGYSTASANTRKLVNGRRAPLPNNAAGPSTPTGTAGEIDEWAHGGFTGA